MSAAAAGGEPARALMAYAALRERLGQELGADPAPQTQELHPAILASSRTGCLQAAGHRLAPSGRPVPHGRPAAVRCWQAEMPRRERCARPGAAP